jgi:hypothetical protein
MISATGSDAGKNASKNNLAGRSQKSIAALSMGRSSVGIGTARRMPAIVGVRHPGAYGLWIAGSLGLSDDLEFLCPLPSRPGTSSFECNAPMIAIRANMESPPRSATSISAWIAARHAGASCSRFGKRAINVATSRKVRSLPPPGSRIGLSKVRDYAVQWRQPFLSKSVLNPFGGRGGFSSSRGLQSGQGIPAPPQSQSCSPCPRRIGMAFAHPQASLAARGDHANSSAPAGVNFT